MEEVAAILSASTAAVKVRVHDARRHIERRLKQRPGHRGSAGPPGGAAVTELRCADVEARFVDAARRAAGSRPRASASTRTSKAARAAANARRCGAALCPRLRGAVPPAPDAMTTRRMQIEIERQAREARRVGAGAAMAGVVGARGRARGGGRGRRALDARRRARRRRRPSATRRSRRCAAACHCRRSRSGGRRARSGGRADRAVGRTRAPSWRSTAARSCAREGPARLPLDGSARDVAIRLAERKAGGGGDAPSAGRDVRGRHGGPARRRARHEVLRRRGARPDRASR